MYKNFIEYETPWAGSGLPYTQAAFVIIDKDGKILTTVNGFKPLNELDSEINRIKVYNDYAAANEDASKHDAKTYEAAIRFECGFCLME